MSDAKDLEKAPLLSKELDAELGPEPVGGHPGNDAFYMWLQLSLRGTVFAMLLATIVWVPAVREAGFERFAPYIPLATCVFIFTLNPLFGQVVNNAHAGIIGTFIACFNIFMMRGFFPDGVTTETSGASTVHIVGWLNYLIFNLVFLVTECRMGTRMFAMACHTGFMLAFLNPLDTSVYSKNFKINPNGIAVSSFIGISMGSIAAIIAMCIPYPWGFAFSAMKSNATSATKDTARLFVAAVKYYSGSKATVLIEQQLAQTGILRAKLDGMGGAIGSAWDETFDIGTNGTIRALHEQHLGVLNGIFDSLHSLCIAMSTEDFGPSHTQCMAGISDASMDVVSAASILLLKATAAAGDGDIDANEKSELTKLQDNTKEKVKILATKFDAARRKAGKPVCTEMMSESFFVFVLSAYARKACEYANTLCTNPPQGVGFGSAFIGGLKGTFAPANTYYHRFWLRYFIGLTVCMLYGVIMDNYGGACAITAVFLLNTRVGPDMMAVLNVLLAVVVGCVAGAVLYSYSCLATASYIVLPVVTFFTLWVNMFIAFGGSSFAVIGLLIAALAPFNMMKPCPSGVVDDAAAAVGLWIGIRGCIIAMVLIAIAELVSVPGEQAKMARDDWNSAMEAIKQAFSDLWVEKNPADALGPVPGLLGTAGAFNSGAILEPRFDRCKWKDAFLTELIGHATKLRLDILTIRAGLEGNDGETGETMKKINQIAAVKDIQKDLATTLEDAREIAFMLLEHEKGIFHGLEKLDTLEGIDELEALNTAIEQANKVVTFPAKPADSMEEDELCQISIVFVMLDYTVKHIAAITKSTVEKQV